MNREPTRVRANGRKVYSNQDGAGIVACCREIKETATFAKINGVMVDLFSASAIVAVHDACNDVNRAKFLALPVQKMATVAFRCIK
jgi:hypothetical protein